MSASNNYLVVHDSNGFENGNEEKLHTVLNFIRDRSEERSGLGLANRLHAIWCGLLSQCELKVTDGTF
jgi:hypothetical protein